MNQINANGKPEIDCFYTSPPHMLPCPKYIIFFNIPISVFYWARNWNILTVCSSQTFDLVVRRIFSWHVEQNVFTPNFFSIPTMVHTKTYSIKCLTCGALICTILLTKWRWISTFFVFTVCASRHIKLKKMLETTWYAWNTWETRVKVRLRDMLYIVFLLPKTFFSRKMWAKLCEVGVYRFIRKKDCKTTLD